MSTRAAELLMAAGLLLLSLGLMWNVVADGLHIGWVEGRGPGAGAWPFWLSSGMALASFWTLARWFRGATPESRNGAPYIDSRSLGLVMTSFAALAAMLLLVHVAGTYIATALFLGFYMRAVGRHSWRSVASMCAGMVLLIYFLFEWQLTKYLPKGAKVFEDGFLWIDNFRWQYLM